MSCSFVGDVADIVRIQAFRSTPLIFDRPKKAIRRVDRTFASRSRLTEFSAVNLLRETAHMHRLFSGSAGPSAV